LSACPQWLTSAAFAWGIINLTIEEDCKRYRLLAETTRSAGNRVRDSKIKAAYEDIAKQYESLALEAEKLMRKLRR
jgi:hypothetical protein